MTQRRKSRSIGLLVTVVFSAVLLWALVAVVWPVSVVYADGPPEIMTTTVTSSLETYFYNPGLDPTGGTVYFNSVGGEGAGQVITVTVTVTGSMPITLTGAPAFGYNPPPDNDEPWEITYTVGMSAETQSGIVFTATNGEGVDTAVITFTQDNVDPGLPASPQARPDGYSETGEYDDDTEIYFTWAAAADNPDGSGIATYYAEIGDSTPDEDAGTDGQDTDTGSEGLNAYYVAAMDHVGNIGSAVSDTITIDLTPPNITGITVTSNSPIYFYAPQLGDTGGTVFFNNLSGEGGGQTITVTVSWTDTHPHSLTGDSAFGGSPGPVLSPPWTLSYTIGIGAGSETNRVFTVTDKAGLTDTAAITFTRDITDPTVEFTDVTNPHYDLDGEELNTTGNWYRTGGLTLGWAFTSTVSDLGSGPSSAGAVWDHSTNNTDRFLDPGIDGDGVFTGVASDGDGIVTVTLTITDRVGNSASDLVVLNLDNTEPTIISPYIHDYNSEYLHVVYSLTVYYGDDMESPQDFEVRGYAEDTGVGPYQATYPLVFDDPQLTDDITAFPHYWAGRYDVDENDCCNGTITVTVSDRVGNSATQIFTYTRDIFSPDMSYGSPPIVENSPYLYASGTTVYYSDRMGGTAHSFTVQGNASDVGAGASGLYQATFSSALGSSPDPDLTFPDWSGTYYVDSSDSGPGTITVRVYDNVSNWSERTFNYIEDTTNPTVALTSVTAPGYDTNTDPLDDDGSNWYNAGDFTAGGGGGWAFNSNTDDDAGLYSGSAFWDHSANQSDRTLPCGTGGDGTFANVSGDANGTVTVTVTITDHVGNSASDLVVFKIDNTAPTITSPSISESSGYLHVDGLAIYYGDEMGSAQEFTVGGSSNDNTAGVGLDRARFSGAFGSTPDDDITPSTWSGSYYPNNQNWGSGTITVTVYDRLGNAAYQTVEYFRDTEPPTVDVNCPPLTSVPSFLVSWSAWDPPLASGLNHFDVQYKVGSDGQWQNWHTNTLLTQDTFGPTFPVPVLDDTTYYFRVRAEDNVGNEQQYTGEDATTYHSGIKKVFLPILIAPDPNWGFEQGNFASWQHDGQLAQSVSTADQHSGSYSALLGSSSYACDNVPVGSAWLRRSVTVPSSGSPTLSFWYRVYTQDKNSALSDQLDLFAVYINDSQLVVKDANISDPYGCSALKKLDWKQVNFSLNAYKGQTIQITFYVYNRPDKWYNTYVYIDDVSVQ